MFEAWNVATNLNMFMLLLELGGALVISVFAVAFMMYGGKKSRVDFYLQGLLLDVAFAMLADVVATYYRGDMGMTSFYVLRISNFLYFLLNNFAAWFVINYVCALIRKNGAELSRGWSFANNLIAGIFAAMLVANLKFCWIYYVDSENIYHRGDLFLLSQVPAFFAIILLCAILICYRKYLSGTERSTILIYVFLPVLAEVLQVFVYGFSWFSFAMAFAACLVVAEHILMNHNREKGSVEQAIEREGKVLQQRLLLFVCVAILILFGLVARVSIGFASNQMNEEILAHYQMLANKTMEQASAWMDHETQIVLNQKASLEIHNDFSPEFLRKYLKRMVEDYNYDGYMHDLYFVNTENVMCSGVGYAPDASIDFRKRGWYVGALNTDGICYTTPYVDMNLGKYAVTVSTQIFDAQGELAGVLALDIYVDKLFDITEGQELPENSYLFIVDSGMGLVTHPNPEFAYKNETPQLLNELSLDSYGELAELLQGNPEQDSYLWLMDYTGDERCFFVSRMEECGWYIVAAISRDAIKESRKVLNQNIFVALIICLVIGVVLTMWATNNMVRKLTEAREDAYAASVAKSRFLANISHEIRTPINAVLGMDEILLRECQDEELRGYALNIQSAGQALLSVVNDILDFSKIESERLELVIGEYRLGELIGSCINLIHIRLYSKGLEFRVVRDDYLPGVLQGDEARVRQIISNLLTNAVKYTKQGMVTLSVRWEQTGPQAGVLCVKVRDTGIGMKPENLGSIFTSFQRFDEKKNRNIEGTGLGLAITKQLVELMGGEISVESEYGVGSEFAVRIPQTVVDGENVTEFMMKKEALSAEENRLFTTADTRILVVDDVEMNLKVIQGLLKNSGMTIDTAERGLEAVEMLSQNQYDLIFLDHMMPGMDGIETLREMQKNHGEQLGNTPVIMLTANAVRGAEEEYRREGFAGYLSKPVALEAIYECLQEFLPKEKLIGGKVPIAGREKDQNQEKLAGGGPSGKDRTESKDRESSRTESGLTEQNKNTGERNMPDKTLIERTPVEEEVPMGEEMPIEDVIAYLQEKVAEFDKAQALLYCGESEEILLEILEEYAKADIGTQMRESFENEDWATYRIAVHSLKSTSITVGLPQLSADAKELETAVKESRTDFILENHDRVYTRYMEILGVLRKAFL